METIGEKIYNLRKENNISQEKLALALGVARQTVSRWEMNSVKPTIENLESLSNFFGVNPDYFLSEEVAAAGEETEPAETVKKVRKLKTLKILALVVAITLLVFCAVACGIAVYVAAVPVQGQEVVTANRFNITGIVFLAIGLFSVVILIALTFLLIRNKKKN